MSHGKSGLDNQACYKVFMSKMTSKGQRWIWNGCVVYLIWPNKAFFCTISESQVPPVFVCFPGLRSPSENGCCSQGFLTGLGSQLSPLPRFWELSGTDKGMVEFAHFFERRGLSETQSACGRPLETLSHIGPKENICVFALVVRTKHPFWHYMCQLLNTGLFQKWCHRLLTQKALPCFRNRKKRDLKESFKEQRGMN